MQVLKRIEQGFDLLLPLAPILVSLQNQWIPTHLLLGISACGAIIHLFWALVSPRTWKYHPMQEQWSAQQTFQFKLFQLSAALSWIAVLTFSGGEGSSAFSYTVILLLAALIPFFIRPAAQSKTYPSKSLLVRSVLIAFTNLLLLILTRG
ncbi:MAG TPA: hypothetical protein VFV37_07015 [Luteibaculaceae bacterium]|nr:hypothetical protein [Luteibaculaceae bacterium]